jgi:quinol monooxygenase YgiN
MKNLIYFFVTLFVLSCVNETEKVSTNLTKNSDSKAITFIIDLAVNADSNEDLTLFSQEITNNVLKTEDFCLEYGYYVSEDGISVTLYEKYINSESAIKHAQNFMAGPFFDRFFNLFTLNKFIVTGPTSDEFKKFTSENGFVIEYRNSIDGFLR